MQQNCSTCVWTVYRHLQTVRSSAQRLGASAARDVGSAPCQSADRVRFLLCQGAKEKQAHSHRELWQRAMQPALPLPQPVYQKPAELAGWCPICMWIEIWFGKWEMVQTKMSTCPGRPEHRVTVPHKEAIKFMNWTMTVLAKIPWNFIKIELKHDKCIQKDFVQKLKDDIFLQFRSLSGAELK